MDTVDLMFADNNEVVVDALISMIRSQGEDLSDLRHSVGTLTQTVRELEKINEGLKAELVAAKKANKASKKIKVGKALKVITPEKRKPGRPKKVAK